MGATNSLDRTFARMGLLSEVEIQFENARDVENGGVLFALPALLSAGLLKNASRFFSLPNGYYGKASIFLFVAFFALRRIRSMEGLRYLSPGEWGKVLGLDRAPEVKTLRRKIGDLSVQGVKGWGQSLSEEWLHNGAADSVGVFYVDGHVRVYHGSQTQLPRHYVAREKLCLRATTEYWVNGLGGLPFFFVNKPVDPGL